MKYEFHEKGGRQLVRTYTVPEKLPCFIGFYFKDESLSEPVAEWQQNVQDGDIYDHELFYVVAEVEIIRNRAKCLRCGDIVESTDRHDFKTCSCGALSVDGGLEYIRREFTSMEAFEDLSELK